MSAGRFPLLRRTLVLAAGQSAMTLVEFLAVILLVRFLAPEIWTVVALTLTVYLTAVGIGGLNIQEGIYFFYGKVDGPRRRGVVLQTAAMLATSGLIVGGLVLAARPWLGGVTDQAAPLLPWIALTVLLELPSTCTPQALVAAERPGWASVYGTAMSGLKVVCLSTPLLLGHGLMEAAQGLAAYAALRLCVSVYLLAKTMPPGPLRIDLRLAWEQLVYTAPLALSIGSTVLNRHVDKWIVAALIPSAFGAYVFAGQELPLVPVLGNAMGTILATRITHAFLSGDLARARAYWLAATSRGALLVGPVTVGIILCAPEAIRLFLDPVYVIAILPFQIYSAILLHRIMAYGMILRAAGKPRTLWFASVFLLVMNVVFSIPLTYLLGLPGTALGTLLAYIINVVFFLYCVAQVMQSRLADVYPWRRYGLILCAATASAGTAWFVASLAPDLASQLGVKLIVYAVGYWLLARALGVARALPEVPDDAPSFSSDLGAPLNAAR